MNDREPAPAAQKSIAGAEQELDILRRLAVGDSVGKEEEKLFLGIWPHQGDRSDIAGVTTRLWTGAKINGLTDSL